jgi:hypothetical protein
MSSAIHDDSNPGQNANLSASMDGGLMSPVDHLPLTTVTGQWPHLSPDEIDQGWQEAINAGPSMIGRQVAYALATSYRRQSEASPPPESVFPLTQDTGPYMSLLTLAALGESLPLQQRLSLLDEFKTIEDPAQRARALLAMAPHIPAEKRRQVIQDAYTLTSEVADPATRVKLLIDLLPLLRLSVESEIPSGIVAETLDIASSIGNTEARLRSLTALAQYLSPTVRIALLLAVLDTIATMTLSDAQAGALVALAPHLLGEVHHRTLTVAAHIHDPAPRARALTALAQYLPARLQPRLRAAALEAIATIHNENDRAVALAAFAPHLEEMGEGEQAFPILLERALALAVNMTRRDARARALVGLQARLPRNLQGEALAAVNTIPDEHTRAQLLSELAPSLAHDIAVAALAVAHNIRQRDARFLALKSLGKRLSGSAAERTWLDALAVAVALPRQLERVLALAELAPNLSGDLQYRTLHNALTTARSIPKERARVRALSTLAPLLIEHRQLLADALADAYTLNNPMEKGSALIALAPYLPPGETTERTIEVILENLQGIMVEYRRARALTSLADYLPANQLQAAMTIALAINDPYDQSTTLLSLLPQIKGADRPEIFAQAWESARDITDHYDRAMALSTLWTQAEANDQTVIVREVLDAVKQIGDDYDRASGLSVFAPLLIDEDMPSVLPPESQVLREALLACCDLPAAPARAAHFSALTATWIKLAPTTVSYALWCEVLVRLSRRSLPHLLSDLAALTPVLAALGGTAATQQVAQVVAAARKW